MDNWELFENETLTTKTQNIYLDKSTTEYFDNEELLIKHLSKSLGRVFLATYKAKIDEVFNQMKSRLSQ